MVCHKFGLVFEYVFWMLSLNRLNSQLCLAHAFPIAAIAWHSLKAVIYPYSPSQFWFYEPRSPVGWVWTGDLSSYPPCRDGSVPSPCNSHAAITCIYLVWHYFRTGFMWLDGIVAPSGQCMALNIRQYDDESLDTWGSFFFQANPARLMMTIGWFCGMRLFINSSSTCCVWHHNDHFEE